MYSEPGDVNALGNHLRTFLPKTLRSKLAVHNTASPEISGTGELICSASEQLKAPLQLTSNFQSRLYSRLFLAGPALRTN